MGTLKVYGSQGALIAPNEDNANYLVDNKIKIDLGSLSLKSMLDDGVDLTSLTYLFTHTHIDHTAALPALLFYSWVKTGTVASLSLYGPENELKKRYESAYEYAFADWQDLKEKRAFGDAVLTELKPGDKLSVFDHTIEVFRSYHTVPALAYRITDNSTEHTVSFSGDTEYYEQLATDFADSDLLVYECNNGADENGENSAKHSNYKDAARMLNRSDSKRLLLTHISYPDKQKTLSECRKLTDKPIDLAEYNKTYEY